MYAGSPYAGTPYAGSGTVIEAPTGIADGEFGRWRDGYALVTVTAAAGTMPPELVPPAEVPVWRKDASLAYPDPALVDGRPIDSATAVDPGYPSTALSPSVDLYPVGA